MHSDPLKVIHDPSRLAVLRSLGLLGNPPEPEFDRFTRLATRTLRTPMSLLTLVGEDRVWIVSAAGLPDGWAGRRELLLSRAFCTQVVSVGEPLLVADVRAHPQLMDAAMAEALGVVAYAGFPLVVEGHGCGALCVADTSPREWQPGELESLRDLAATASTELALRRSGAVLEARDEQIRDLLEHGSDMVVGLTQDGHVHYANASLRQALGYSAEELSGRHVREFVAPDFHDAYQRAVDLLLRDGVVRDFEAELVTRDGGRFLARGSGNCRLEEGRLTATRLTFRDATAQRRVEEAILAAGEAAEMAVRAKSQFLSNMSHEIRTPLSAIVGLTDLVLDGELRDEQRRFLQMVQGAAGSLRRIVDAVLDFSHLESGRLVLTSRPLSLRPLFRGLLASLAVIAERKGVALSYRIDGEVPDRVLADACHLRQLLENVVNNALKFTDEGEVSVRIGLDESCGEEVVLHIVVRDTGIGVPRGFQEVVLAPFTQVNESADRRFGGMGLGLAIASQIVARMGGRIWMEANDPRGTAVHVTCRVARDRTAPPPPSALRILIAEDEPIDLLLARTHLEQAGHEVVVATNGLEAVDLHAIHHFDAILMDVHMPGISGLEATTRIREREREWGGRVPIIASTAHSKSWERDHCIDAGMDAFIAKPVRRAELLRLLEGYVGLSASQPTSPPRQAPAAPGATPPDGGPRLMIDGGAGVPNASTLGSDGTSVRNRNGG